MADPYRRLNFTEFISNTTTWYFINVSETNEDTTVKIESKVIQKFRIDRYTIYYNTILWEGRPTEYV